MAVATNGSATAPPHDLEAEQSVLGAILLSERSIYGLVVETGLKPEDFYRDRHGMIYDAIRKLFDEGEPVDVLTVVDRLKESGQLEDVGGAAAVHSLAAAVPQAGHARRYATIVKESALLRRLLTASYEISASVQQRKGAPRELVERAERSILEVAHDDRQKDFASVDDILHRELQKLQKLSLEGTSLTGIPSGFKDLDEITGGFQRGNLIVLAARPAMGKCLAGETLVYDPSTGEERPIEQIVSRGENGGEFWVASVGPDLRLRARQVTEFIRNGKRPLYRLQTKLGRELRATANHPLLTIGGWKRIEELAIGDLIAVPRTLSAAARSTRMLNRELATLPTSGASSELTVRTPSRPLPLSAELAACLPSRLPVHRPESDVWWDEVSSLDPDGVDETYDISVQHDHNFVANDVVVHNSALVTNMAENAAVEHGKAVALFSLEMAEAELAQRFVASQARIKGDDLSKGRVRAERWPKILQASQRLASAPLYVDDSSDVGLLELRAKARRLHSQRQPEGLGLIIVDYLQLMGHDSRIENRAEQVGQLSRGLKILARELNVPVIALSQLNRGVEARSDKVPLLSDLRESGAIEQDADLVIFIYRDDYYDPEGSERQGEADLIIAKHRNGAVGKVTLTFQPEYPKFSNFAAADRYAA